MARTRRQLRRRAVAAAVVASAAVLVPAGATAAAPAGPAAATEAATEAAGWPIDAAVAATPRPRGDLHVVGSGWGHSVGMSQYGARAQALAGRTASAILQHYYPGTQLATRSDPGAVRVGLQASAGSVPVTLRGGEATWRCVSGCSYTAVQASVGQTWTARPRSGGGFVLQRPGVPDVQIPGSADAVLAVDHHGAGVVEGPNPIRTRARYAHGRLELTVRSSALTAVQVVPTLELYLRGLAEMPSSWPDPALRAQAIVGRTYALRALARAERPDCLCHLRATPADQAYTGYEKEAEAGGYGARWVAAVDASAGRAVTYQGQLAETYYSSSHGGRTENVEDSWAFGTTAIPYLRSVDDPWSVAAAAGNPRAAWTAVVPAATVRPLLPTSLARLTRVVVQGRTDGGTPQRLLVTGVDASGVTRTLTWPTSGKPAGARLRSAAGSTVLPSQQLASVGISRFPDAHGDVLEEGIAFVDHAGVTTGVSETAFAPRRVVTREQMASFLDRAFDLPAGDPARFVDVPAGTHRDAIVAIAAAGITTGCSEDRFCPLEPVTREQMASFLARALGLTGRSPTSFVDVGATNVHARNIEAVAHRGITAGCSPNRFCPTEGVTRAQMATFLYRTVRG